jgi:hypothetical protein
MTPPTTSTSRVTVDATPFWKPWESSVSTFSEVHELLEDLYENWIRNDRTFAWRGVVNAAWSLHSSLYRRLAPAIGSSWPDESELEAEEGQILADVHRWGLHQGQHGRLSILEQLAVLQHFGAPTRLIDVTFNAYVALWFAVEAKGDGNDSVDGRLVAIDVTERLINEDHDLRQWEMSSKRPWRSGESSPADWCTRAFAWRPPPFERRIAAQHGGFLLGGVPSTATQWPKTTSPKQKWKIDQVRGFTSLAIRAHKLGAKGGADPEQPVFTVRIAASAKPEIRKRLADVFGYTHRTLFPDYAGFAAFGTSKQRKP